jgi:hypothetical protein
MLVVKRSASFFDSILGILEVEDKLYRVVGTSQGEECFRDNDAGGQESYEPRAYHTDMLCADSDGQLYWVYRRSSGTLYREATSNTSGVGRWRSVSARKPGEFYLDATCSRIIWKSEIKEDTQGGLYILDQ